MAMSAGVVWQVQNGGNDASGGAFRGGSVVSTPSAPSVSATSGGAVTVATYYCVVTVVDGNGETAKSAETAVTTDASHKTITVTHPTDPVVTNATWNLYVATASGGPYWQQSTGNLFTANLAVTSTPATSGTQAPGVDYSQQASAQVVVNNSTVTATSSANVVTFTGGYTPTAADVGNVFHATAGTNVRAGWYEITAWTATTWTVAGGATFTTSGSGSAITGNMGGAFATPGGLGAALANDGTNNGTAYIKYNASAYTCGSTSNAAAGRLNISGLSFYVTGYDTTRTRGNTDANRPVLDAGAASMTVVGNVGGTSVTRNLSVTNSAARASVVGFNFAGFGEFLKADSCATGITVGTAPQAVVQDCWANACGVGFNGSGSAMVRCVSTAATSGGFNFSAAGQPFLDCVAIGSATSTYGFQTSGFLFNCVSRDNLGTNADGFVSAGWMVLENCISYHNTRYGINPAGTTGNLRVWNCASGSSGTADVPPASVWGTASYQLRNLVTLTADPHTNAAGLDLSLNSTAGGGAACRAAGLPGSTTGATLPGLSTNAYPDLGPAQHADAPAVTYFAF